MRSTTSDTLLNGRVFLSQPEDGYRAAIDPVLLAAAVPARPGETVLDLGCGVGAATLCLAARLPDCRVTGIELDPETARLAEANVRANKAEGRVEILVSDIAHAPRVLFDRAMMNPPYLEAGAHTEAPSGHKARSHGERQHGLADWVEAARLRLKPRGTLTLIHRADRLDDAIAALAPRFGGITLLPLWPKADKEAKRVLLHAVLGGRGGARLLPGLVLHELDGRFTPAADAVLREAAALKLTGSDQ